MMGWIILLIVLGIFLFLVELFLLPGITIAAIGSFCCLVASVSLGFIYLSPITAWIITAIVLLLIVLSVIGFMKVPRHKKITLSTTVDKSLEMHGSSIGDQGVAMTRLAPMGKVMINGEIIEAKTMGVYVDEGSMVEVIGVDNMNVVVRQKA